jgi:hypothetical protein
MMIHFVHNPPSTKPWTWIHHIINLLALEHKYKIVVITYPFLMLYFNHAIFVLLSAMSGIKLTTIEEDNSKILIPPNVNSSISLMTP